MADKVRFPDAEECISAEFLWNLNDKGKCMAIFVSESGDKYTYHPEGYKGIKEKDEDLYFNSKCLDNLTGGDGSNAYVFTPGGCFDPPMYLIFADSFDDAYSEFITVFEKLVEIDCEEDYDMEEVTYNDNGTPVDTDNIHGFDVKLEKLILL